MDVFKFPFTVKNSDQKNGVVYYHPGKKEIRVLADNKEVQRQLTELYSQPYYFPRGLPLEDGEVGGVEEILVHPNEKINYLVGRLMETHCAIDDYYIRFETNTIYHWQTTDQSEWDAAIQE